jgi:hypothetical protein
MSLDTADLAKRRFALLLVLALLQGCGQPFSTPRRQVAVAEPPFPKPNSPADIQEIELRHTGCFGTCPIYRFTFSSKGSATYEGERFVLLAGTYEAPLDSAVFASLSRLLIKSDAFDLASRYAAGGTDHSSRILTIVTNQGTKVVNEYGDSAPARFHEVVSTIDSLGGRLRWHAK